jgi:hypothetical protein
MNYHCTYRNCPFCARDYWRWLKARMRQMSTPRKGETISFADAAATSIRPPK